MDMAPLLWGVLFSSIGLGSHLRQAPGRTGAAALRNRADGAPVLRVQLVGDGVGRRGADGHSLFHQGVSPAIPAKTVTLPFILCSSSPRRRGSKDVASAGHPRESG